MIRVVLAEGLHKQSKTIIEIKHFDDEKESEARKWASDNVSFKDGKFVMIYTCEDDQSPSFDLLDVVLPNKEK
jgi:hypothetical protein